MRRRPLAWIGLLAVGAACSSSPGELPVLLPAPPLPEVGRVLDLSLPSAADAVPAGEGLTRVRSASLSDVDPGRLLGPAVVVDYAPGEDLLRVDDLRAWESRNGPIPAGAIVLARSRVPLEGAPKHPGWSVEAARFLVNERAVAGAGVDTPAFDPARAGEPMARQVVLESGRWVVENLRGLARLPEAGATAVVLPLALTDADSAPARAIAVLPR